MKKVHLKSKKSLNIKLTNLIAIFIILLTTITFLVFAYIKKQIMPSIYKYGTTEATKFSNIIINSAIDKYISSQMETKKLFDIIYDTNNEIKIINLNTNLINSYTVKVAKSIQKNLKYIEQGNIQKVEYLSDLKETYDEKNLKKGIIFYLNAGFIFNNPIFSNFGGKIPIKLALTGDITNNIKTEVDNYGINNAIIKIYINIKITQQIILPFSAKDIVVETKIPLITKIINGTVPNYYGNLNSSWTSTQNK